MSISKSFLAWIAVSLLFIFSPGGVYGKEIRVTGKVNPGDTQWKVITRPNNAERGIDVVLTYSARIVTGGKPFKLVAQTLTANPGSRIIAFDSGATRGANGQSPGTNGSRGTQGKNAGGVSLEVYRLLGNLQIDVRGQAGGHGGNGAQGRRGANGNKEVERTKRRCRDKTIQVDEQYKCRCVERQLDCRCRNVSCNCRRVCTRRFIRCWKHKTRCSTCRVCDKCPKTFCQTCTRKVPKVIPNGHCWNEPNNIAATNGGNGGPGGNAGPGGNGGLGGNVILRVRDHYDAKLSVNFRGGAEGKAGQPGAGGAAGAPGRRVLLSAAQRGAAGPSGKYARNGRQGKGGKVQIVSIAHLEKQRDTVKNDIQTLENDLKKTKTRKNELVRTLAEKYPWVKVWFNKNFKRPYQFFKPDIHAGPNSDATFRALIAGLKLSDPERKRLNDVRNDFLRMKMNNKIVGEIEDAIKRFEKQLQRCQGKLANASNWKNAKVMPLRGENYKLNTKAIVADNKVQPSSCRVQ